MKRRSFIKNVGLAGAAVLIPLAPVAALAKSNHVCTKTYRDGKVAGMVCQDAEERPVVGDSFEFRLDNIKRPVFVSCYNRVYVIHPKTTTYVPAKVIDMLHAKGYWPEIL